MSLCLQEVDAHGFGKRYRARRPDRFCGVIVVEAVDVELGGKGSAAGLISARAGPANPVAPGGFHALKMKDFLGRSGTRYEKRGRKTKGGEFHVGGVMVRRRNSECILLAA